MKCYKILNREGQVVAYIESTDVRWIEKGVDFQPNLFNGYHAVEIGEGAGPAVLNLPVGMSIAEELSGSRHVDLPTCPDCGCKMVPHRNFFECNSCGSREAVI